jgi:hypothetical protein
MNAVRRAVTAVAVSGAALAGVTAVSATAAMAAKAPAPTALAIKAPAKVTYSVGGTVTGVLTTAAGHKAISGQTVTLEERAPGTTKWAAAGTQVTGTAGKVSFTVNPARSMQVELAFAGTSKLKAATSATATVNVAYDVTAALSGHTVTVTVAPTADNQKVLLQLKGKKGWATVATKKLAGASKATFTVTPPTAKGTYSYRVLKLAAHGFLAGTSNVVQITV